MANAAKYGLNHEVQLHIRSCLAPLSCSCPGVLVAAWCPHTGLAAGEDRTLSRSFSSGTLNHSVSHRTDPQNLSLTREGGDEGVQCANNEERGAKGLPNKDRVLLRWIHVPGSLENHHTSGELWFCS